MQYFAKFCQIFRKKRPTYLRTIYHGIILKSSPQKKRGEREERGREKGRDKRERESDKQRGRDSRKIEGREILSKRAINWKRVSR